MPNVYTNYKMVLETSELTTLYTVGSETTAIVKSLRVSNIDKENNCMFSVYLVDTDSVSYNMETDRIISKGTSDELLKATSDSFHSAPIVLKESEVIKIQAQNGGDLHVILSVLEIS